MKLFKKLSMFLFVFFLSLALVSPLKAEAATVKLNRKKASISVDKSITLKVKGTSKKARWSTSDKKVATVKNGKVTGKKEGTVTITAKVGSRKLTCTVTVKPALSKTKTTVLVGNKTTLTVKGTKSKVTWSSSRKKIATVKNGVVTGKKAGVTYIIAKVDGYELYCTLVVAPTAAQIQPSYDKLKAAILASPYIHTDGNRALKLEEVITENTETESTVQGVMGLYAVYEASTGYIRFEMLVEAEGANMTLSMTLDPATANIKSQPVKFLYNYTDPDTNAVYKLSGSSRVHVPSHDSFNSNLSFRYDNAASMSAEEKVLIDEMGNMLPNMYLMLAVTGWDEMITEKTKVTFKSLGFVANDSL